MLVGGILPVKLATTFSSSTTDMSGKPQALNISSNTRILLLATAAATSGSMLAFSSFSSADNSLARLSQVAKYRAPVQSNIMFCSVQIVLDSFTQLFRDCPAQRREDVWPAWLL